MSIKLMNRVWNDSNIKANRKLLLLALADFSNDEGVCYPSQDTLVKKCGLNKATVNKYIKDFQEQDILIQAKRNRKSGGRLSSKYLLFPLENYYLLDEQEKEIFEPKFNLQTNDQSLTDKPKNSTQSLVGKPKPSLYYINHHLYKKLNDNEKNLFREYLELRKRMKCQSTENIIDRLLVKYFEYNRNIEVLENAIMSNWKDFYPLKTNKGNFTNKNQGRTEAINTAFDMINNNNNSLNEEIIHEC